MHGADEEKILIALINKLPVNSVFTIHDLLSGTGYAATHDDKISFGKTLHWLCSPENPNGYYGIEEISQKPVMQYHKTREISKSVFEYQY